MLCKTRLYGNAYPKCSYQITLVVLIALLMLLSGCADPETDEEREARLIRETRVEAAIHLMNLATGMERCYTRTSTYTGCEVSDPEEIEEYRIDLEIAPNGRSFEIAATPIGSISQLDNDCGTLGINNRGQRTVTGSGDVDSCWMLQ